MKLWNIIATAVASFLAVLGTLVAYTSTLGCVIFMLEEPEMPKSLIK